MNEKGNTKDTALIVLGIMAVVIIGVGVVFIAVGGMPSLSVIGGSTGTVDAGAGSGDSTSPSLQFNIREQVTRQCAFESTVRIIGEGVDTTGTTTSCALSVTNLGSGKTYSYEVYPSGATTNFYPFVGQTTTSPTGPKRVEALFRSVNTAAVTSAVKNRDNSTSNATAQAWAANSDVTGYFEIDIGASPFDANVIGDGVTPLLFVVDGNKTAASVLEFYNPSGLKMSTGTASVTNTDGSTGTVVASVPGLHSQPDSNRSDQWAFLSDVKQMTAGTTYKFKLYAKNTNGQEPVNSGDSNASFRISIYDGCRVEDPPGTFKPGYEDNYNRADKCRAALVLHYNAS